VRPQEAPTKRETAGAWEHPNKKELKEDPQKREMEVQRKRGEADCGKGRVGFPTVNATRRNFKSGPDSFRRLRRFSLL